MDSRQKRQPADAMTAEATVRHDVVVCPWCGEAATPVRFMTRWHPVLNGVLLLAYRCCKSPCYENADEGWFEIPVKAVKEAK